MDTKNIIITGGTGFIGKYLSRELLKEGHFLSIVTRSPQKYAEKQAENRKYVGWNEDLTEAIATADVVINLAGENLFGKRWSAEIKEKIYNSRIESTRKLVNAMKDCENKPDLFISASGINYYGDSGDQTLDESSPAGDDFLATVCKDWEKEAQKAAEFGVRVVNPRTAMVLGDHGGALEKMKFPFHFFVGGPIGSGNQYVPWVHIKDFYNSIYFAITETEISGPYNASSPDLVTMNEFAKTLGNVMNRPSFFKVPEMVLKTVLGEAALPLISSLRVKPKVLQISGFEFEFDDLETALADIF